MPIIEIHGIPAGSVSREAVEKLIDSIRQSVASIDVLRIHEDDVTVFCIADLAKKGLGEELIAEVKGLYEKPERTGAVLEQLRIAVHDCLWDFAYNWLPQNTRREVLIGPMIEEKDCTFTSGKISDGCPQCRGRGRFGSDTRCNRCGGSGELHF